MMPCLSIRVVEGLSSTVVDGLIETRANHKLVDVEYPTFSWRSGHVRDSRLLCHATTSRTAVRLPAFVPLDSGTILFELLTGKPPFSGHLALVQLSQNMVPGIRLGFLVKFSNISRCHEVRG